MLDTVDEALRALVGALHLEQKVRLLTGADIWSTVAEPAIGLRSMMLSDGPSGVRGPVWDERDPSLNLPSATALAATWDLGLARRYGAASAAEAKRKGVDVVLGPTINLHRSPLGGRHFEAYSEDPLLTGELAAAYVRSVQEHGIAATPKHYVANDFETERYTADVELDDRALRELYLAPFEAAVRAGAWLVMSAYNSVRGVTMSENPLLTTPLRTEWGFDGLVVSDWVAVRSTEASANADQDLVMPGPVGPWGPQLVTAVRAGAVPEAAIDAKVLRLLRLAQRVGALDLSDTALRDNGFDTAAIASHGHVAMREPIAPEPETNGKAEADISDREGRELAREVAAAGMVLLRNSGELPWPSSGPGSIAVIGEAAIWPRTQGGGSATVVPAETISPVDGLRAALPDASITVHPGVPVQTGIHPLPLTSMTDPRTREPGLRARFLDADGNELLSELRRAAQLVYLGTVPAGAATLELSTEYRPGADEAAAARLGVAGVGRIRMEIDGAAVIDTVLGGSGDALGAALLTPDVASVPVAADGAGPISITVRQHLENDGAALGLVAITVGTEAAHTDPADAIADAAALAGAADAAVVVVGTSSQTESEGFDRTTLALPGAQDDLVRAVAAANPRTVVVVNSGGPVLLPWRDEVSALLLTWFGGQEIGHALADVLLGRAEPGGRLPTTWPAAEADVPVLSTTPVDGVLRYTEGIHIGYRAWLRAGVTPAYPFGHGLGYTTWELADLAVSAPAADGSVEVSLTARNTGAWAGKQVVQVYLSRPDSVIERPVRWLAGFATVFAEAGASVPVRITLPRRAFEHWDGGWRIEPGEFTVSAGTSVVELPLSASAVVGAGG
ncbi:beta-glucosidase [Nocardia amikacinitolerans]|uniref:beta-glucosidase family protein n=1 Tax=Nocardia amikacinitolerans TaxID=756689 RepID=UPI0020A3BDCF|nr:glycoside hydrolase family 3 C-terminal domain-containing protein [Nocardia amikacinitolerans]MCP2297518.1 beta-glucosidase [Nocardia amikacinitolerans]